MQSTHKRSQISENKRFTSSTGTRNSTLDGYMVSIRDRFNCDTSFILTYRNLAICLASDVILMMLLHLRTVGSGKH